MSVYTTKRHLNSTNVRMDSLKRGGSRLVLSTLNRIAPVFARGLVSRLFFTPARRPLTETETLRWSQGKPFSVVVHGKTIRGRQWGRGPAVLLVHGWNGRGMHLHRFIRPLVGAGFAVIAFDAPGHGESAGETSSYFEFTDAVRAFVKADGGFRVSAVIAHSLGAAAAVNALVKEKSTADAVLIAPALRLKEILYGTFDRYGIPAGLYRQRIAELEQTYGYSLLRDNPFGLLKALVQPVLIIHDRDDDLTPYADAAAAAGAHATIRLHATTGLGHKRILSETSTVDAAVRYIIERQPLPAKRPAANGSNFGVTGREENMRELDTIVADYRHSDDGKRLNLFLQWPSLRSDFIRIEQGEKPPVSRKRSVPQRGIPLIWRKCRAILNIL